MSNTRAAPINAKPRAFAGVNDRRLTQASHRTVVFPFHDNLQLRRIGRADPLFEGVKRAVDIAGAATVTLLISPLLAGLAVAIKADSKGPVLFKQRRTGRYGQVFYIYKFRSMTTMDDGAVVRQAEAGDQRVTRLGRFIRATSLDELPQLFNVLRGEMSLVGPRPHALAHDEFYAKLIPGYRLRQAVKPGITGLAQVRRQRGPTPTVDLMANRVESDIQYVRSRSVMLDLKILVRTVFALKGL
ncbi:MAG: sugar transferase [Beijerinckiaceae bacterium]